MNRTRILTATVTACLALGLSGCASALGTTGALYQSFGDPRLKAVGFLLGAAANQWEKEEANKQWATCPHCGFHGWWPRDGLRTSNGSARCNCGQVFTISGY